MPIFSYKAVTREGKAISATLDARSQEEAKRSIIAQDLLITDIHLLRTTRKKSISKKQILSFFEQLQRLLQAKLPLYDSLLILESKQNQQGLKHLCYELAQGLKQGHTLSNQMKNHAEIFDDLYMQMVENGEESGSLDESIAQITSHLHQQLTLKQKIVSALTYPLLLFSFCMMVMFTLLFYVVPTLTPLFEGRKLHPLTKGVIFISDMACQSSSVLLITLVVLIFALVLSLYTKKGREKAQIFLYKIPLIRRWILKVCAIRFCFSLSSLLYSGLTLHKALSQTKKMFFYPEIETIIHKAGERILQGKNLSLSFSDAPLPFSEMGKMIAIAEESGNLPEMLRHIGQIHQKEVSEAVQKFTTLIQPIMLLFLGLVIGCVVLAILLPLCDASSILDF
jgi:general secretion pathway protein F